MIYRWGWAVTCSLLAVAGGVGVLLDATPALLVTIALAIATTGLAVERHLRREVEPRWRSSIVAALIVFAAALVAGGLCRLLGSSGLWVIAAAVLSAPPVVAKLLDRVSDLRQHGSPHSPRPAPPPSEQPLSPRRPTAELTDQELCEAWRSSFLLLQQLLDGYDVPRQIAVVMMRQDYIDELERRNAAGFQRWLASGAEPASDPSRFICPS